MKRLTQERRAGLSRPGGLRNVRLGNIGRFVRTKEEYEALVQMGAI